MVSTLLLKTFCQTHKQKIHIISILLILGYIFFPAYTVYVMASLLLVIIPQTLAVVSLYWSYT